MATKINDFAATARLWQSYGPVETEDTTITSDAVDMLEGDGPAFAILNVGEDAGSAVIQGSLEGSDDGTTWAAIDDAEFAEATGGGVRAITFTRPKRYVRAVLDVQDAAGPLTLSVVIGQSRKMI